MEFSFDPGDHIYTDVTTGQILPSITQLIEREGLIDKEWFTDECRVRGTAVHRMTADYDLGGIEDVRSVHGEYAKYVGWLQAHAKAMSIIRPTRFTHIEVPLAHQWFRFAGCPDRGLEMYGALSVLEIKSGDYEEAHEIQTAMQAILFENEWHIPAESIPRFGLYLKGNGKFKLEEFVKRSNFDRARSIIAKYCEVAS